MGLMHAHAIYTRPFAFLHLCERKSDLGTRLLASYSQKEIESKKAYFTELSLATTYKNSRHVADQFSVDCSRVDGICGHIRGISKTGSQ